jgi:hypothetical protein
LTLIAKEPSRCFVVRVQCWAYLWSARRLPGQWYCSSERARRHPVGSIFSGAPQVCFGPRPGGPLFVQKSSTSERPHWAHDARAAKGWMGSRSLRGRRAALARRNPLESGRPAQLEQRGRTSGLYVRAPRLAGCKSHLAAPGCPRLGHLGSLRNALRRAGRADAAMSWGCDLIGVARPKNEGRKRAPL